LLLNSRLSYIFSSTFLTCIETAKLGAESGASKLLALNMGINVTGHDH
jgi:hypothetical protein